MVRRLFEFAARPVVVPGLAVLFGVTLLSAHGMVPRADLRGAVESVFPGDLTVTIEGETASARVRPDGRGRFAFADVPAGAYVVRIEGPYVRSLARPVTVDGTGVDLGRLDVRPTTAAVAAALYARGVAHPDRLAAALPGAVHRLDRSHPDLDACMDRLAHAAGSGHGAVAFRAGAGAAARERVRAAGLAQGLPPRVVDDLLAELGTPGPGGRLDPADDFGDLARTLAALKARHAGALERSSFDQRARSIDDLLRGYEAVLPMYGLPGDTGALRDLVFAYVFLAVHPRAAALCA